MLCLGKSLSLNVSCFVCLASLRLQIAFFSESISAPRDLCNMSSFGASEGEMYEPFFWLHGPAQCPFQKFVRRLAGFRIHICKFYNLDVPALQSPLCLISNLHLTNIVQSLPSLGLSILYGHQVLTYGTTPRPRMTLRAQPVLGVFYSLPWV